MEASIQVHGLSKLRQHARRRPSDLHRRAGPCDGLRRAETVERPESITIDPWAGLAVVGAYALGSLVIAALLVRRRDV